MNQLAIVNHAMHIDIAVTTTVLKNAYSIKDPLVANRFQESVASNSYYPTVPMASPIANNKFITIMNTV